MYQPFKPSLLCVTQTESPRWQSPSSCLFQSDILISSSSGPTMKLTDCVHSAQTSLSLTSMQSFLSCMFFLTPFSFLNYSVIWLPLICKVGNGKWIVVVYSVLASSLPVSHDEVCLLSLLPASSFFFYTQDNAPADWQTALSLTAADPTFRNGDKCVHWTPKINRIWLIAATVTLSAQTVRTRAREEMRGALWEESQSHLLWKRCATEISKASLINPITTAFWIKDLYPWFGQGRYVANIQARGLHIFDWKNNCLIAVMSWLLPPGTVFVSWSWQHWPWQLTIDLDYYILTVTDGTMVTACYRQTGNNRWAASS